MSYKTLLLSLYTVFVLVPRFSSGQCNNKNGEQSFILTTNAIFPSSPEFTYEDVNVTECAKLCQNNEKCKSLNFQKNITNSKCELLSKQADTSLLKYQRNLSAIAVSYHMEKICIPSPCQKIFAFEVLKGMILEGYDDKVLKDVNKEQCLTACFLESEFRCRSVEWDERSQECHLSRYDRFNRNSLFKSTKASSFYFDNSCSYKAVSQSEEVDILLLGNVYHPYTLEEYVDISLSDCRELCARNKQFACRSFLFGQRDGVNYCGLTHQNRVGLLRTPNNFKPTDSISYYELASTIESCDSSDLALELIAGSYLDVAPYKEVDNLVPGDCTKLCKSDSQCKSLNIDYDAGICRFLTDKARSEVDGRMKTSQNFNYFQKTCVLNSEKCSGSWVFERVRGKTLIGVHTKLVVRANTKEECQSSCLTTKDFVCRSAEYNYELNECRLSAHNRFSTTDQNVLLEDAKLIVDYFESNCYTEARGFCNLKKLQQRAQILADDTKQTFSMEQCRDECFKSEDFVCRSFTYDFTSRICQLSHHTRHSVPKNGLRPAPTTDYYDINTCFAVSVTCEPKRMVANVKTNKMFHGRLYAKSRPTSCQVDITDSTDFTLPVSLEGPECGTTSESEGKFSNVIVIQANDRVVTSVDKAVGVHCSYKVGNKTEEAVLSFNITDLSAAESSRGTPDMPNLSMRIVDIGGEETNSVNLGDVVRVQVLMDDESTYGIFLRNMVARSAFDNSELTLIDDTGCPVEVKMMKEVRRLDGGGKALESYLEAFSFTGSNLLKIETEVETCINNCKPVTCQIPTGRSEDVQSVLSYGKRRKRSQKRPVGPTVSTVTLARTFSVKSSEFGVNAYQKSSIDPVEEGISDKKIDVRKEDDVFCVERQMAALVGSLFLFVQCLTLAICIACMCKRRIRRQTEAQKDSDNSIYYENCKY